MRTSFVDYFAVVQSCLERTDLQVLAELRDDLLEAYSSGKTVFFCGNGGSGSTASHLAQDVMNEPQKANLGSGRSVKRFKSISLCDNTPSLLATANDRGFEQVFVQQLRSLAEAGDLLVCLSGSGNSENVLLATEWANAAGLLTWGVCGFDGGLLQKCAAKQLHVPCFDMGIVESLHLTLLHGVVADLVDRLSHSEQPSALWNEVQSA